MTRKAIAAALTLLALDALVVPALAGDGSRAGGSAPVHEVNVDASGRIRVHDDGTVMSQVTNFPLNPDGSLKTSGGATVTGTVEATQSGPWTVGLDPAASSSLTNIETATAGLQYDGDGNLMVSVAGSGSPADPSAADQSPFGFSASAGINAGEAFTVTANPNPSRVTSYFVQATQGNLTVLFGYDEGIRFAFRVAQGQSATGALAHAILTDKMTVACADGSNCIVFYSVAGY